MRVCCICYGGPAIVIARWCPCSVKIAFDINVLKQVATEIANVKAEYVGVASPESVDLVASESLQKLAGSKVPQFVPLFVGRFTRARLRELTGIRPPARFSMLMWHGAPGDNTLLRSRQLL